MSSTCVHYVPSNTQVSRSACPATGSPPNSTVQLRAVSKVIECPIRLVGPNHETCLQHLPSHDHVSVESTLPSNR